MPDEDQLFFHPVDPTPSINRSTSSLEEQIARLPTRRDLARLTLVVLFVSAVLGIVGIEAFWRYMPKCGLNPAGPLPVAL